MKRVAVVIVTYNSAAEIGGCLDSLAPIPDIEIVVVDNASADTTREVIASHPSHSSVNLIANMVNAGFAAAVNQGVRATTAPFVLLLNPDAHVVRGLDALASRCALPGIGAAGGMLVTPGGVPQTGFMARNLPSPTALIFEVLGINRVWPGNPVNWHYRCMSLDPMILASVEQPAGAFLMFPRMVWERLGGLDERFTPLWFEDVDFCARIKQAGLRAYYDPAASATHSGSHSIGALSVKNREKYWYGNLLEYAARHYGALAFRAVCSAVVLGSLLRAARGFAVYGSVIRLAARRFLLPQRG